MQNNINRQVGLVIECRKQLAGVEAKRGKYQQDVPADIWKEFVEISRRLEKAEEVVRQTCHSLAGEVNGIRSEVVAKLKQYNQWRKKIRQIEEQFLASIIRPGYQLKLATRQREKLEREYQRIYDKIHREEYPTRVELEQDIHRVLAFDDAASEAEPEIPDENLEQEEYLYDLLTKTSVDDVIDAISQEELVTEFKRVVIPKIHPDTSDTPPETFITVYEAFKKADPLLMEAYIVEYRGEVQPEEEEDVIGDLDRINGFWKRYQRLLVLLERRFSQLLQELTQQELENPEKILEKFEGQRQEIISRIQSEADQIIYWREKIERLTNIYSENIKNMGEG